MRCSSLTVAVAAVKPPVVTAWSKVRTIRLAFATVESLSTKVLRSWLQPVALL